MDTNVNSTSEEQLLPEGKDTAEEEETDVHALDSGVSASTRGDGVREEARHVGDGTARRVARPADLTAKQRLRFILSLWPYTIPLFTVYWAEYAMQAGTWAAIGKTFTSASK